MGYKLPLLTCTIETPGLILNGRGVEFVYCETKKQE